MKTLRAENVTTAENQQERLDNICWYIAGFVDGEGSFNISLRKKVDYRIGWQPILSFNVSQKELTLLRIMKKIFACGIIKRRKDGLHSLDITSPKDLQEKIIPFFDKYYFLCKYKSCNFCIFKKAVKLMLRKEHLTEAGFRKLIDLREKINFGKGRTRKYTKKNIFQESSETICQA